MKPSRYAVLLLTSFAAVYGDVVVPSGPWQTVTTPATVSGTVISSSVNTNGTATAYWNNSSTDSPTNCLNVGCFVTGESGLPNSPDLSNPVYLGNNDGSAINDFYWNTPGQSTFSILLAEIAGNAGRNWVGWYQQGSVLTTANRGTDWDVIFAGTASSGAASSFTPSSSFGLWFLSDFSSGAATDAEIVSAFSTVGKFTESSRNSPAAGSSNQYFAAFARSASQQENFWVGVEDLTLASADRDYNDMILSLQVVPEPRYYAVLTASLFGAYLFHRRQKRRRLNRKEA